jgi:tape measure domain-containing protein
LSKTIDERVVGMQFDNKHFESNVQTSLGTIEKLKNSLNMKGASKGLEDVSSAASNVNMSGLGNAVETVKMKFSALQIMGITALTNITNSAVNAGKRIVSALTVDPIKSGLSEYETKINAIQTIMSNTASKGTTMEDVTRVIGELNTYADKTIYNFAEMTRNIGTFTAAGVGLEESATAIQGIANLAAASGSTSQQASTAMYQLSQALSSGSLKLMDWNSVVNAGMGGQKFQDALKATAREHGIAVDDMVKKHGSFRESLQEGWISADILNTTLRKFTVDGAKAYAQSMLDSGKYTQEQADALIKEAEAMNDAATKVKTFTQLCDTLKESAQSGWSQSWEIIVGDFEEAKEFFTELSDILGGLIGESADARNEMLENWKVLGGRTDLIDAIRNSFEGVMSIMTPIKEAFREIFPPITSDQLVALTKGLKTLTEKMKLGEETSNNLKRTFKGLFAILGIVKEAFSAIFKAILPVFGGLDDVGGGILGITANIGDMISGLHDTIKATDLFSEVLKPIAGIVGSILKAFAKLVVWVKDKLVFPGLEKFRDVLDKVKGGMTAIIDVARKMKDGVAAAIDSLGKTLEGCTFVKLVKGLWNIIKTIGSAIAKVFSSLAGGLVNSLGGFDAERLLSILNALISGGVGIGVISLIKSIKNSFDGIGDMFEGVTNVLDDVRGCFKAYQTQLKAGALLKIASAIAILVVALLVLTTIDAEKLSTGITAITMLFTELLVGTAIIGKLGNKGLIKTTSSMVALSAALLILAFAMKVISSLSISEMLTALVGLAGGLALLVVAVNMLPQGNVKKAASAVRTLATALLILSLALKIMGSMSLGDMIVGLIGMAGGLAMMVAAVKLLPKDTALRALGMTSLATAMVILATALKIMGTMSWGELAVGLVAMAGSMLILAVGMKAMMTALPGAAAMLIVAPALLLLAASMVILGTMSWGDIARSLVALVGSLAVLSIGLLAMMAALPGAAALIVVSAALAIFIPVLLMLGMASWETIGKGLLTLAASFTIIGVAAMLLTPLIPALIGLGVAVTLLGVGCLAAGVGIFAFAAGLSMLVVAGAAGVTALVSVLVSVINLIPMFVAKLGEGFILLLGIIADSAPAIAEALNAVIAGLCNAITVSIPVILTCIGMLLEALLSFIVEYVPKIVDAGLKLVIGLIDGLTANLPGIIQSAVDLITAFIRGIGQMVPQLVDAGFKMIIDFVNGLADSIRENTPLFIEAVNNLMDAAIDAIFAFASNAFTAGGNIIQGVIDGVKNMASSLWDAMVDVASSAWDGFLDFFGINSPARLGIEAGGFIDEGLAIGLKDYANVAGKAAVEVGETTMDSLSKSVSGIADVIGDDIDAQPTIRPVLDLSEVQSGAKSIGGLFGDDAMVGVVANAGSIGAMMNRRNQNGANDDVVSAIDDLRKDIGKMEHVSYNINGITYDGDSDVAAALETIIRAATIERRT